MEGEQSTHPALKVHRLEVVNRYLGRGCGGQKFLKLIFNLQQVWVLNHLKIIAQNEG